MSEKPRTSEKPRIEEPQRQQGVIRYEMPEDALPIDHPARVLWMVFGRVDLSKFLDGNRVFEGGSGRSRKSPRMLLTLWTYAISRGIGSAREIERLVRTDLAFQWITGEQTVSRTTISDFRRDHLPALEGLMTNILAALLKEGVLSLETVATDGMRVRANASAPSFRSADALEQLREQAKLHLEAVLAQADDPELSRRVHAARVAKAVDFKARVEAAIETVEQLQEQPRPPKQARASTTDPDARNMKMADGGFRPGFNVQFATAGDPISGPRTIVGVNVTNVGSDMQTLAPLIQQIEARLGALPKRVLADSNHANFAHIEQLLDEGIDVIIPPNARSLDADRKRPYRQLSPTMETWIQRMQSDQARLAYRGRASLCELTNAHARSRYGMRQFLVRGIAGVTCVSLLTAITHNVLTHAASLLG